LALLAGTHLKADDDPTRVFPSRHPYIQGLRELRESKGWQSIAYLLTDRQHPIAQEKLDELAGALTRAPALEGNVSGFETARQTATWLDKDALLPRWIVDLDYKTSQHYKQLVDGHEVPRAALYVKNISVRNLQSLKAEIAKLCPAGECHAGGELIAYSDFATQVPKTLVDSMGLSMILVGIIVAFLAFAFRKQG